MRREPRLTDGDCRGVERAPVEVAVAQHAAGGRIELQRGELAHLRWQVAGIAPLGSAGPVRAAALQDRTELLARLVQEAKAADVRFTARWVDDRQDDGDLPA